MNNNSKKKTNTKKLTNTKKKIRARGGAYFGIEGQNTPGPGVTRPFAMERTFAPHATSAAKKKLEQLTAEANRVIGDMGHSAYIPPPHLVNTNQYWGIPPPPQNYREWHYPQY
jgi:hypothetical protein